MTGTTTFAADVTRATEAASAYYNGADPLMSDDEYDALIASITTAVESDPTLAEVEGVDALLNAVAAGTVKGDVEHSVPMLSLSKSTDLDKIVAFADGLDGKSVAEPKIDGIAAVIRYVDGKFVLAATRGDGSAGEDLSEKLGVLNVNFLPHSLSKFAVTPDLEVRGEIYMSPEDFEVSNEARVASGGEPFANPRNATSGTVMRQTARYNASVSFAVYEVIASGVVTDVVGKAVDSGLTSDSYTERMDAIETLGFQTARSLVGDTGTTDIREVIETMGQRRAAGQILAPLDGAVVKADSTNVRDALGSGSRHPRWAMAFKFPAAKVTTTLLDIERAVGRTGNLSYTAVMEPVLVDGSTVSKATLHNADFIAERDFRIGDTVVLFKAGDIIPRIEEVVTGPEHDALAAYVAPTTCPDCDEELDRSGAIWRCLTPTCSVAAAIAFAVSRDCLDVDGFSTAIADALVEQGMVTRLSDLFYLDEETLAGLVMSTTSTGGVRRLGSTVAKKILSGLDAAKSQPLNRVVCALGIRKSGRTMSRRMVAAFGSMESLKDASVEDFVSAGIEGVGLGRATHFVDGFAAMAEDIERMAAAGVNMVDESADSDEVKVLAGKKVVVTGSMKGSALDGKSRNEMNELIEAHGGKSSGSVSASTDILVCGEEGSSKWTKAKSLGTVEILTPEEFASLLGVS